MTAPAGGTFGQAYIDFSARTTQVDDDVRKGLAKVQKDIDPTLNAMGKFLAENITEGIAKELSKPKTSKSIGDALSEATEKVKVTVKADVDVEPDRSSIARSARSIAGALASAIARVRRTLGGGGGAGGGGGGGGIFGGIFGGIGGGLGALGSSVGNVSGKGPFGAVIGGAILAAIPAIVGAVGALLNVFLPLVNAVFLLPAGLGVLAASIVPVTVAFQGFGEAIEAISSGDPEKINEALKGLSKSAQNVARDYGRMLPFLRDFQKIVQESFFQNITEALPRLQQALGGTFLTGFKQVANAAGGFAMNLVRVAENPRVQLFFRDLFTVAAGFIQRITPAFAVLLLGIADLGRATLPTITQLANFLAGLLEKLGNFLTGITQNGELNLFMSELKDALRDLGALAASGWNLIKAIIGGTGEANMANGFLALIIETFDTMTAFFESEIGKEGLRGMVILAGIFVVLLADVVIAFGLMSAAISVVFRGIESVVGLVVRLLELLGLVAEEQRFIARKMPGILSEVAVRRSQGGGGGLAHGEIVRTPGYRMLGEGYRPEVVIPLTEPARARELAMQSGLASMLGGNGNENSGGITFGANSIQVNFVGTIPTQEEAYRTGAAVGSGISDQLARRNARLAVRTL